MIDKICPQCHKAFQVPPSYSKQICCSKQCSYIYRQKREIVACAHCGKDFTAHISQSRKYCSQKCAGNYERTHQDKSKRAEFVCKICGKGFEGWVYRQPTACSRKCSSALSKGVPKPTAQRPENYIESPCEMCGKPFWYHKGVVEKSKRSPRFCSPQCRHSWLSENMIGENNPNWVEGEYVESRGPNWGKQSRAARKRDGNTCQHCGEKEIESVQIFDVHHIKPFRLFGGDYVKANRLSNLVLLCRKCHNKADHEFRKREKKGGLSIKSYVARALAFITGN